MLAMLCYSTLGGCRVDHVTVDEERVVTHIVD